MVADRSLRLLSKVLAEYKSYPIGQSIQYLLTVPLVNRKFLLRLLGQTAELQGNAEVKKFALTVASGENPEDAALAVFLLAQIKFSNPERVLEISGKYQMSENVQTACLYYFAATKNFPPGLVGLLDRIFQNFFTNANISTLICQVAAEAANAAPFNSTENSLCLKVAETLVVAEDFSLAKSALLLLKIVKFDEIPFSLTLEIGQRFRDAPSIFFDFISSKENWTVFGPVGSLVKLILDEFLEISPLPTTKLLNLKFADFCAAADPLNFASKSMSALARDSLTPAEAKAVVKLLLDWIEAPKPSKNVKLPVFKKFEVDGIGAVAILGGLVEKFGADGDLKFVQRIFRLIHEICRFKILREQLSACASFAAATVKFTEAEKLELQSILIDKVAVEIKDAEPQPVAAVAANLFDSYFGAKPKKPKGEAKAEETKADGKEGEAKPTLKKSPSMLPDTKKAEAAVDKKVKEASNWVGAGMSYLSGDASKLEKMKKKAEKKRMADEIAAAEAEEKRKIEEEKEQKIQEAKKAQQLKLIAAAKAKARAAATEKKGWFG